MPDDVRWIRSYVLERDATAPSARSASTRRRARGNPRHAVAAALPVDEIVEVADTVIVARTDPGTGRGRNATERKEYG